jgi:hypothetical protein
VHYYMDQGHISLRVVNVTWIDLDLLAFILHFLNQFWIASRSVFIDIYIYQWLCFGLLHLWTLFNL